MADEEKKSEDVMELLDSLDKDEKAGKTGGAKSGGKKGAKKAGSSKKKGENDEDIMGFLDSLAKSNPNSGKSTPARAHTPREPAVKESENKSKEEAPKEKGKGDEEPQKEEQSTNASIEEGEPMPDPLASLTSWWSKNKGGLWNSATSAVKQAEQRVREFQPENLPQHSQQAIDELGGRFGFFKNALTGVLETIAPPIGKHEELKIHIFHDMVGYPAIDTIVYNVFDRVMQQVEGGGELTMVVQKGKERHRRGSDHDQQRDLNLFKGDLDQAKKLAAANVEDYVRNNKAVQEDKSADEGGDKKTEESPSVRTSDIYLSIQPIAFESASDEQNTDTTTITPTSNTFSFVIYLSDPDHDITFSTVSQAFPYQWAEWLDKPEDAFKAFDADPRDWVIDWVEEGLGLAVGVVAQSYVTKRMGVDAMFSQSSS